MTGDMLELIDSGLIADRFITIRIGSAEVEDIVLELNKYPELKVWLAGKFSRHGHIAEDNEFEGGYDE